MIFNNKKGIATELFTILIFIFLLIISIMFTFKFVNQFQTTPEVTQSNLNINITQYGENAIKSFDGILIFLMIVLTIWVVVSAFYIQTNPVFFVIGVIALIPLLILSAQFTNLYNSFVATGEFTDFTNNFTSIPYIMSKLPLFLLLMGIIILISLYAKERLGRTQ